MALSTGRRKRVAGLLPVVCANLESVMPPEAHDPPYDTCVAAGEVGYLPR